MKQLKVTVARLLTSKIAVIGLTICVIIILVAIFAPFIETYDPLQTNIPQKLKAPSGEHIFGTDELGRDLFSRLIEGTRITVIVGIVAVLIALILGTILGVISGYYGGWIDTLISGFIDTIWAFPTIILALAITTALGNGLFNVLLAIGIVYTPSFARIVRSMVLTVRETEYVQGAKAVGLNDFEIITRYILPNTFSVIIVQTSLNAAQAILTEASLSFMGLGLSAENASWGALLRSGFSFMTRGAYWLSVIPGIAIMVTVLGLNFLGDGLRDALDVRLRME
ncbi:MAG: ABC transporter permease [Anaerolineaceae bacterium]|nr:ABC transporter permease [Anaerolineaceae bacterium]